MNQKNINSIIRFAAQNFAKRKILVSTDIVKEVTGYNGFTLIPVEEFNEGTFVLPGIFKYAINVSGIDNFNEVFDTRTAVMPAPDGSTDISILTKKLQYPHIKTVSV